MSGDPVFVWAPPVDPLAERKITDPHHVAVRWFDFTLAMTVQVDRAAEMEMSRLDAVSDRPLREDRVPVADDDQLNHVIVDGVRTRRSFAQRVAPNAAEREWLDISRDDRRLWKVRSAWAPAVEGVAAPHGDRLMAATPRDAAFAVLSTHLPWGRAPLAPVEVGSLDDDEEGVA